MKRFVLVLVVVSGCSNPGPVGAPDLMPNLPDGFLQTGCNTPDECDDGDPCTVDTCAIGTRVCAHAPKSCDSVADACNDGVCDRGSGVCETEVANEGMSCTDGTGAAGACKIGICTALPTCTIKTFFECGFSVTGSGDTSTSTAVVDTYTCGSGFTGHEVAYTFYPTLSGVTTVTLTSAVDLDLMVLEGSQCSSGAVCTGKSITVGSGNETVSFLADSSQIYTIIVDSKGASGAYTVDIGCPVKKQICEPGGKVLSCNQTLSGNTASSAFSQATLTSCTSLAGISGGDIGPEDSYVLQSVTTRTNFKLKLTGLTQDLDIQALYSNSGTDCDGSCEQTTPAGFNTGTADETIAFTAYSGSSYYVIVDSRTPTGGPYQLEVDCPPSCSTKTYSLSCYAPAVSGVSDDALKTTNIIDSWGSCATGTIGPETVYSFYASTGGSYTFDLTFSEPSADLALIVMKGSSSSGCDPTDACAGYPTVTTGTQRTVTTTLVANTYYYIAVDSRNLVSTPYSLRASSSQCTTASPNCRNGNDKLSCAYPQEGRRSDDPVHSLNAVDAWGPPAARCASNTTGSEVVYAFAPTDNGTYTVNLTGIDAGKNLDLIVMSGIASSTCDPTTACVAASTHTGNQSEQVTFTADKTKYYWIAVDGVNGDFANYNIALTGAVCAGAVCADGLKNLDCGSLSTRLITNSNDAIGATNTVSTWGTTTACATGETGPEFAHKFVPEKTGSYTFQLIGLSADLDIIVVEADSNVACNAAAPVCVGAAIGTSTTSETLTGVTLTKNKAYYIIVDGKNGAISNYTLAITGC